MRFSTMHSYRFLAVAVVILLLGLDSLHAQEQEMHQDGMVLRHVKLAGTHEAIGKALATLKCNLPFAAVNYTLINFVENRIIGKYTGSPLALSNQGLLLYDSSEPGETAYGYNDPPKGPLTWKLAQ